MLNPDRKLEYRRIEEGTLARELAGKLGLDPDVFEKTLKDIREKGGVQMPNQLA